ncbi:hypothetical protein ABW19_dt0201799 [Dactylella cylindrospora]|nr:hypothetical protein ABW19_dt0201799 [Dactylella cylindrospora]
MSPGTKHVLFLLYAILPLFFTQAHLATNPVSPNIRLSQSNSNRDYSGDRSLEPQAPRVGNLPSSLRSGCQSFHCSPGLSSGGKLSAVKRFDQLITASKRADKEESHAQTKRSGGTKRPREDDDEEDPEHGLDMSTGAEILGDPHSRILVKTAQVMGRNSQLLEDASMDKFYDLEDSEAPSLQRLRLNTQERGRVGEKITTVGGRFVNFITDVKHYNLFNGKFYRSVDIKSNLDSSRPLNGFVSLNDGYEHIVVIWDKEIATEPDRFANGILEIWDVATTALNSKGSKLRYITVAGVTAADSWKTVSAVLEEWAQSKKKKLSETFSFRREAFIWGDTNDQILWYGLRGIPEIDAISRALTNNAALFRKTRISTIHLNIKGHGSFGHIFLELEPWPYVYSSQTVSGEPSAEYEAILHPGPGMLPLKSRYSISEMRITHHPLLPHIADTLYTPPDGNAKTFKVVDVSYGNIAYGFATSLVEQHLVFKDPERTPAKPYSPADIGKSHSPKSLGALIYSVWSDQEGAAGDALRDITIKPIESDSSKKTLEDIIALRPNRETPDVAMFLRSDEDFDEMYRKFAGLREGMILESLLLDFAGHLKMPRISSLQIGRYNLASQSGEHFIMVRLERPTGKNLPISRINPPAARNLVRLWEGINSDISLRFKGISGQPSQLDNLLKRLIIESAESGNGEPSQYISAKAQMRSLLKDRVFFLLETHQELFSFKWRVRSFKLKGKDSSIGATSTLPELPDEYHGLLIRPKAMDGVSDAGKSSGFSIGVYSRMQIIILEEWPTMDTTQSLDFSAADAMMAAWHWIHKDVVWSKPQLADHVNIPRYFFFPSVRHGTLEIIKQVYELRKLQIGEVLVIQESNQERFLDEAWYYDRAIWSLLLTSEEIAALIKSWDKYRLCGPPVRISLSIAIIWDTPNDRGPQMFVRAVPKLWKTYSIDELTHSNPIISKHIHRGLALDEYQRVSAVLPKIPVPPALQEDEILLKVGKKAVNCPGEVLKLIESWREGSFLAHRDILDRHLTEMGRKVYKTVRLKLKRQSLVFNAYVAATPTGATNHIVFHEGLAVPTDMGQTDMRELQAQVCFRMWTLFSRPYIWRLGELSQVSQRQLSRVSLSCVFFLKISQESQDTIEVFLRDRYQKKTNSELDGEIKDVSITIRAFGFEARFNGIRMAGTERLHARPWLSVISSIMEIEMLMRLLTNQADRMNKITIREIYVSGPNLSKLEILAYMGKSSYDKV